MKRFVLVLLLVTMAAGFAAADSQWDITVSIPYYIGAFSGDFAEFAEYAFVLPNVKWHYYFGPEWLQFGAGLKLWTLIVESAIYPMVSLESNLDRFVINAGFGGGAIFAFGLYTDFLFEPVFFPELSVAVRLGKRRIFSLGTSITMPVTFSSTAENPFIFVGMAFARWTF